MHKLNTFPFNENGVEHPICVEDMEGSPEQKCPKWIADYCRGQNLRYTHPCWCWHPRQVTDSARYTLEAVDLEGAKGNEIVDKSVSCTTEPTEPPICQGLVDGLDVCTQH